MKKKLKRHTITITQDLLWLQPLLEFLRKNAALEGYYFGGNKLPIKANYIIKLETWLLRGGGLRPLIPSIFIKGRLPCT